MQKIGQERIASARSWLRSLFESFFTLLLVSSTALFTIPPLYSMEYSMVQACAVDLDADSLPSPKPSFAQRFIDPVAKRVLPENMALQYRYHTERQNQKPFKPKYRIDQSKNGCHLGLLPQKQNHPRTHLENNLTVMRGRDDGYVYRCAGSGTTTLRGDQAHGLTNGIALQPGQVFFHNGILIEKAEGDVVGDYYFFEYLPHRQTHRRLFLQETPQHMPAPDGSCFEGEKLTDTPEISGRPVVDENGELLYVEVTEQNLALGDKAYLVTIHNAAGERKMTYITRDPEPFVYRPGKQNRLFTYLEDCVDTVKLHPNRARILFMSAVSACLSIPLYGALRLCKKLIGHKKTHKKSANKQKPKSSDNKNDKSNTNQTGIQKATAQEASSEKENIITAQKHPRYLKLFP